MSAASNQEGEQGSDMDEPMASQGQVGDSNHQKKLHFKYVDLKYSSFCCLQLMKNVSLYSYKS